MNAEPALSLPVAPCDEAPTPAAPRHLLVLSPGVDTAHGFAPDEESLHSVARWLTQFGYVYVAKDGQKAMEDDQWGVRRMPLNREALPAFGNLALAVVFDSFALLQEAQQKYPGTLVTFVESASSVSARAQLASMILRRAGE